MKTVGELKKELLKFKDDDLCYAYEGEVEGIVICRGRKQGLIFCSEDDENDKETLLLDINQKSSKN